MFDRTTCQAHRIQLIGLMGLLSVTVSCPDPSDPGNESTAGAMSSSDDQGEAGGSESATGRTTTDTGPDPSTATGGPVDPTGEDPTTGVDSDTSTDTTTGNPVDPPQGNRVLMYVAFNNTWWPEYKVMYEGLVASGYSVDVRSSTEGAVAMTYGDSVNNTSGGLVGVNPVSYEQFQALFEASFGATWNPQWNAPATIPLSGRIQDADMGNYVALVFPGGSGTQFSRYDGEYEDLPNTTGNPEHIAPAADIASAAAAINNLVVAALVQGSPVLAVCHAGPTPGFARIPGTEGQGPAGLGISVLNGRSATGFPLPNEVLGAVGDVAEQYAALGIQFLPEQAVVVDGPGIDLNGDGTPDGADLVVTARSWYPEEVVQGLRSMLDLLE